MHCIGAPNFAKVEQSRRKQESQLLAPLAAVSHALGIAEGQGAVVLDELQHSLESHLAVVMFRVEFDGARWCSPPRKR
jgi:hypothetical protein